MSLPAAAVPNEDEEKPSDDQDQEEEELDKKRIDHGEDMANSVFPNDIEDKIEYIKDGMEKEEKQPAKRRRRKKQRPTVPPLTSSPTSPDDDVDYASLKDASGESNRIKGNRWTRPGMTSPSASVDDGDGSDSPSTGQRGLLPTTPKYYGASRYSNKNDEQSAPSESSASGQGAVGYQQASDEGSNHHNN